MEHVLKTLGPYWDAVERGDKNFEVRRDDRGFQRGDTLVLRKLRPDRVGFEIKDSGSGGQMGVPYRGATYCDLRRRITYVLTGGQLGIEAGFVVLSLADD